MAAGEVSGRIHLFDLNSDAEPPFPASHLQLSNLQFSPDDTQLASVGFDGTIKLWNLPDGSERLTLTTTAGNLFSIAWLADGSRIFGGSLSGAITVWDVATRRETFVYQAHRQPVMGIAGLPDGTLISSGPDGVCKWPITRDLPK